MKHTVLICDDDVAIVDSVEIFLSNEGYHVLKAHNGKEALQYIESSEIHLLLLDIMMPEMDGFEVMRKARLEYNFPIIMVTAKSEDLDKIMGLNLGADDYLTKPYNPLELIARVRSQVRRYTKFGGQSQIISSGEHTYKTGELFMDSVKKEVTVDDEIVSLTATEFGILELLLKNKGRVYAINEIYENVWKDHAIAADNTIAVHIRRIREKIEIDPKNPKYLKVVWGIGYKIEDIR
ncbi:response regulator transcription factor [Fusibacter ferrireducens]|uniref:Stage 0 sporulation protein A homolog n=1 Tax=Fusibacter ferrireducens TaxID=2785058 RepID=A0ABR9ZVY0_9FIRM|nr:response regulator transcription factor [Fusibacter ferrireducens]MBF4694612.1 response regulator transcription factor [Fusibacter ferrireducens]